jgi:hypothetical protein
MRDACEGAADFSRAPDFRPEDHFKYFADFSNVHRIESAKERAEIIHRQGGITFKKRTANTESDFRQSACHRCDREPAYKRD